MMERTGRSDRTVAQAGPEHRAAHPPSEGSRTSRGKAHRHDHSTQPVTAESPQDGRRKESDMLDRYPQYIGRHGVGIVVLLKDSFGFVKCGPALLTCVPCLCDRAPGRAASAVIIVPFVARRSPNRRLGVPAPQPLTAWATLR